ncbi:MAG: sensory histidine kinase AtoS [Euryarchaeota archaeon ADurb.Bin294]|nr:MAG: sensory histidine kinase AtoS [Euryarchaeota archaeon ADurb.Bin294]
MVALSHSCDLFLTGYEALPNGIVITDPNLLLLFFNQSFREMFHLDDSYLNNHLIELLPKFIDLNIEPESFLELVERIKDNPHLEFSQKFSCLTGDKWLETKSLLGKNDEIMGRIWIISDISKNIQTTATLEDEEGLFKTIFNLAPEGIAISDLTNGQFFEVNKQFTDHWGYTRDEVIGKSAIDLDFWVDLNQRQNIVDLMKKDGSFSMIPVKMRGKDKKIKDILLSGVMIAINHRPYMLTIPLDITDILAYEEKIWSLASFIELNPNPIFEMNGDGNITFHNTATTSVIRKLTNTADISLFIPGGLDEILNAVKNGDEISFHREITISGRFFHEYIYITKVYRTARVYVTDITERKLAEQELIRKNEELGTAYEEILSVEEELRQNYDKLIIQEQTLFENEKKLRMIVDHIPGIVVTTDTNMVVKSIYGEGLINLGLSSNERVGQKIGEVFHQADNAFLEAYSQALMGIVTTMEVSYKNRRYVLFTSPLRDVTDSITGAIGVAIDITNQKKMEEERKRLLLQLEHNLVELALLNDKIRNPLTVISSLVEMHAPEIEESVIACVQDIDNIITNLDKRWAESEKTMRFLQKHYGIGAHLT